MARIAKNADPNASRNVTNVSAVTTSPVTALHAVPATTLATSGTLAVTVMRAALHP
jgi:hypothetical protein